MGGTIVRIGGGCGFYGDSSIVPGQLIAAGIDYLAEATMSVLGAMRRKRDTLGYAMDLLNGSGRTISAT